MSRLVDTPQVSVAVCVDNGEGDYLLQCFKGNRYPGHWGFAGGKVDATLWGEMPEEAAKRELMEEAGIVAYDWKQAPMWSYDRYEDTAEHFVCVYFSATSHEKPRVMEPDKTDVWHWLSLDLIKTANDLGILLPGCARYFNL